MATKLFQFGLPIFLLAGFFGPVIFNFIFGTQWKPSGKYMQILIPWLFVVFISSPLSFLPDLLKRQKKAMWLDILKFIVRIPAFGIGVYYNNLYLAIILFSLVSLLFAGYNLYWYLSLARLSDIQENKERVLKEKTEIYRGEIGDF